MAIMNRSRDYVDPTGFELYSVYYSGAKLIDQGKGD
jgi:hypothetical protein